MSPALHPIQFLLNDQSVTIDTIAPSMTVLRYLREIRGLTGTKEGCAEGDCGACTVLIGERKGDDLQLRSVNACIQFVPTLHGKMLYTVEYLRQSDGELHPVQQAMVDCHGSQCGFCTPGFVMSLWGYYLDKQSQGTAPSKSELRTLLSGNLCRCTGYKPILAAGIHMFGLPTKEYDKNDKLQQLDTLTAHLSDEDADHFRHDTGDYFAPHTLAQLLALRSQHPDSTLLAGCTDIGLWVNKQFRELNTIIYLGNVTALQQIEHSPQVIRIGAAVSLTDSYGALAHYYPGITELWQRFASVPIRNAGTLVGNLANGSPIGDSAPWLIAVGARVELQNVDGQRTLALEELYTGYQQQARAKNEVITAVMVPLPTAQQRFRTWKVCKRYDSDISAVCGAFQLTITHGVIDSARVAFGGMAATSKRATQCEAALNGKQWSQNSVEAAMRALDRDFTPLSDMRASAEYRSQIAKNLLYRFYLETRDDQPLNPLQTRAFTLAEQPS
ncbi:xanthine dehydrogenase small subunit [Ketobacter sp.]